MTDIIQSPTNTAVKELVKLRESPRRRRERQCFVVEGAQDLQTLIDANREVLEIYFNEDLVSTSSASRYFLHWQENPALTLRELGKEALLKASYRKTSDGVLGVVKSWDLSMPNTKMNKTDTPVLIFDEIEKPGNLGAILRTSEALGSGLLLLSEPKIDYFQSKRHSFISRPHGKSKSKIREQGRNLQLVTGARLALCCHKFQGTPIFSPFYI